MACKGCQRRRQQIKATAERQRRAIANIIRKRARLNRTGD